MANLPETPQWEEGIYQIEVSDPVLGGPDGISNRQGKQLASRTLYLKQQVEKGGSELAKHIAAADPHTQYAPKASPTFTGTPTAPTPANSDNSKKLATTEFVAKALAALAGSAPETLDTLKELADALGNDPNFATTVLNKLAEKLAKDQHGADIPDPALFVKNLGLTTALNGKQPLDATLTALAALVGSTDKLPYFNGADAAALTDLTAFARTLLGRATANLVRSDLGLGSAATADIQVTADDPTVGRLFSYGAWGLGAGAINTISWGDAARQGRSALISTAIDSPESNAIFYGLNVSHHIDKGFAAQWAARGFSGFYWRSRDSSNFSPWRKIYDDTNTTRGADGALKVASPVIKIFADGRAETNDESEGATATRVDVGQYLITGVLGMNSDAAWGGIDGGFDIPKDRNRQPLVWLDYEVNPDGSILVKTFHRTYPDAPEFARNRIGVKDDAGVFTETVKSGDPVDIPADQFVSVRVEMPHDSIYNQNMTASIKAMEEAELARKQNPQEPAE